MKKVQATEAAKIVGGFNLNLGIADCSLSYSVKKDASDNDICVQHSACQDKFGNNFDSDINLPLVVCNGLAS